MYHTHFRLHSRPFRGMLPGQRPFAVPAQEAVLAQVTEAFHAGERFIALVGTAGMGKTFVARQVAEVLTEDHLLAWITAHAWETRTGLLQGILYDLGLPHQAGAAQELRMALTDFLLEQAQQGRSLVLVVDDAHHLEPDLLEELRQWGDLGGPQDHVLQVLFVAQPPFRQTLQHPLLTSLRHQIAAWLTLEAWEPQTAAAFLREHVHGAGGADCLLTDEALETIVAESNGIPRVMLQTANRAFWLAAQAQAEVVDLEAVWEALAEFRSSGASPDDEGQLEDEDSASPALAAHTPLSVPPPKPHKVAG